MSTHNFANINEKNISKSVDAYFETLLSKETIIDKKLEENKKQLNVLNYHCLKNKLFMFILNDALNKLIEEDSIDNKNLFYEFIIREKKLLIIIKHILQNLQNISKNQRLNKQQFYSICIDKFEPSYNLDSEIDYNFILSCDLLKFFSFKAFEELYLHNDLQSKEQEKIVLRDIIKNVYFYVKHK